MEDTRTDWLNQESNKVGIGQICLYSPPICLNSISAMFRVKKKKANENSRKSKDLKAEVNDDVSLTEEGKKACEDEAMNYLNPSEPHEKNPNDEHNEILQAVQEQQILSHRKRISTKMKRFAYSNRTNHEKNTNKNSSIVEEHVIRKKTLLSFIDENSECPKKRKRKKMRSVEIKISDTTVTEECDVSDSEVARNDYSLEGIEALRREQKLAPSTFMESTHGGNEEVVLNGEDGDYLMEKSCTEKETAQPEISEEYIPLHSRKPNPAKNKNRVNFGPFHTDYRSEDNSRRTASEEPIEEISDHELELDQESRAWEDELIRRGGHHKVPATKSDNTRDWENYPKKERISSLSVREATEKVRRLYNESLARIDQYERELVRSETEKNSHEKDLISKKNESVARNEELDFFQGMKNFVSGLCFCLRDKAPIINETATAVIDRRSQRWKSIQHEAQIMREAAITYMVAQLQVPKEHFMQNTNVCISSSEMSVDQLLDYYRKGCKDEGLHVSEKCDISTERNAIFDDVISEFCDLNTVCSRFREWRDRFPQVYEDTYCRMILPKLYSPYVAAELLSWDPLAVASTCKSVSTHWSFLNDFQWLQILRNGSSVEVHEAIEDSDQKVLHEIISGVVLPKIKLSITQYAVPYSRLHGKSMQYLIQGISAIWKDNLQPLEELLLLWVKKICDCATEVDLVQIDTSALAADDSELVTQYTVYQLERYMSLIENGIDVIQSLSIFDTKVEQDSIANRSVIDSLRPLFKVLSEYIARIEEKQNVSFLADVKFSLEKIRRGLSAINVNSKAHEYLVAFLDPILLRL